MKSEQPAINRRIARWGIFLLLAAAVFALLFWQRGLDLVTLRECWNYIEAFLQSHRWWLFISLIFLPGFPFPVSALLVLTGAVWREHIVFACFLILLALALNMTWTYWLAAKFWAKSAMEQRIHKKAESLFATIESNPGKVLLITRLTPGIPLFVQNYVLGILRIPFWHYLSLSLLCNSIFSLGLVLSGAGISGGNFKLFMPGITLIVVGVVVIRMWLRRVR